MFSDLFDILSGNGKNGEMENRLYMASVSLSIILTIVFFISNLLINIPSRVNYTLVVLFVFLAFLLTKALRDNKHYKNLFIVLGLVILSFVWIFNGGLNGSINYVYLLALILFLSISPQQKHRGILLLVIVNLIILHGLFFLKPEWISTYDSEIIQRIDLIITFSFVLLFIAIIYRALFINYDEEKYLVEVQMTEIELQNKYMIDSIHYARDIQSGILQKKENLTQYFNEYFVFWRPKDIVSGDFYVFKSPGNNPEKVLIVVGDCTGHGVPGALLTMLGMSFINEIILQEPELQPYEILNRLREKVKFSLSQGRQASENRDGMDMIICLVDKKEKTLQYSGSNRSLFIARNNEILEYKGDRMPIGVHVNDKKSFTNYSIDLQKEDTLYLFTDGYADQYGQKSEKKYYISKFKKFLLNISDEGLLNQGKQVKKNFDDWKGDVEQTDDVLVVGVKPLY